ncbi:NFACT RNA binding domain-containing protein [Candidatus Marsarchaeota archaeon]|jgi:predicted ribosome quality control (RQC) complex YloA/Tae2 family protein|nr:NFACT RNA binding domain-containing protein [Candidatus Marsarchaeota archaeon]MCL5099697.1 NFACT RNA binding domain-containing protein [Candidatus Marsarchaeota archaeon]
MDVDIDFTKSAQDNANAYYEKAKKLERKRAGAEKAMAELEKRFEEAGAAQKVKKRSITTVTAKEWYEKFHWFLASNGMLAIGGRDARQNEAINSKHFDDNDLFFHSDIFGASVVVLKNGTGAPTAVREEAAQFAACYSSAWEKGLGTIDVYAMKRDQVGKLTNKGALGTGSFSLRGEREWYRGVRLALCLFVKDGRLNAVPAKTFEAMNGNEKPGTYVTVEQGSEKKSDAAKSIAAALDFNNIDAVMQQLPSGSFMVKKSGSGSLHA